MEAATAAPKAVAQTASPAAMFKYSTYLHVGDGAAECEHREDGECQDTNHFHAWCRLPNSFQHQDIRDKGLAAKARRVRDLKDPESNASVVLDQKLDLLRDEAFKENVIEELLMDDWAVDWLEAVREADEQEEFEHINQDREELSRLDATEHELPEEERSEAYKRLSAHVQRYIDAVNGNVKQIQEPKRAHYDARPVDALVDIVRAKRVDIEGDRVFMDVYAAWMWFVGTFKVEKHHTLGRPHIPMWPEIGTKDRPAAGTMFGEAPEVIFALKVAFEDLQMAQQQGSSGNS